MWVRQSVLGGGDSMCGGIANGFVWKSSEDKVSHMMEDSGEDVKLDSIDLQLENH